VSVRARVGVESFRDQSFVTYIVHSPSCSRKQFPNVVKISFVVYTSSTDYPGGGFMTRIPVAEFSASRSLRAHTLLKRMQSMPFQHGSLWDGIHGRIGRCLLGAKKTTKNKT
jgi:hypothetical protein